MSAPLGIFSSSASPLFFSSLEVKGFKIETYMRPGMLHTNLQI